MGEYIAIFLVLVLIEIIKQNPPVIFLNYNSDRLYKKIMHLLKTRLNKCEERINEKDKDSTFTKKDYQELLTDTKDEIKELIGMRNLIYELIGKYQDKSMKYNHIAKSWVEYLQIYEELEDANSHDEVGAIDILGYDNMRIMQFKLDAIRKALKELSKQSLIFKYI